jgi:glycosyltransferase involved in cell wall biosynthesis
MITYLKKHAPKANLKLVHDSVEWYSQKNFKFGLFSFGYLYKIYLNQVLISKSISVISISSFLQTFYTMKNILSIRIPVILTKYVNRKLFISKFDSKKIKIIYAGSPARKDLLDDIIKATIIVNEKNNNIIQLNIIGVENSKSNDVNKSKNIIFHGKKKRSYILKQYRTANYSILIRPQNMIYSRAGFPTKIVESLSHSVPVITNLTSDLNLYLKNFQNSIICYSESLEDIIKSLTLILEIDDKNYLKLCYNAGVTYKENFYYKNYLNEYKSFIFKSLKK